MANKSKVREIIIILDCCYSGGFGNDPMSSGKKTLLREGVTVITSSREDQVSQEEGGKGVFTEIICEALEGEAADILGHINIASIYHYADQVLSSWQQRPIFKSHASTMITIRNCQPRLHPDIIRQLPIHFKFENSQIKLSPEYLIGEQPYNPEKEIVFSTLQMYFSAGLVSPTEDVSLDKQMRDVAKEGKSCKLTKLGEYYWKLAKRKRL